MNFERPPEQESERIFSKEEILSIIYGELERNQFEFMFIETEKQTKKVYIS